MWVFGYGSLMWDGWEAKQGCARREQADLLNYVRVFDKPSRKRWGTRANPGPTLNLQRREGERCRGIAFEFPDELGDEVRTYLSSREGRDFPLQEQRVALADGVHVMAQVPLYIGNRIVADADEITDMVLRAKGEAGTCIEYVSGIAEALSNLDVEDPAVSKLWHAVQSCRSTSS